MIGRGPIVFDREFSYRELLNSLVDAEVHFVIRLNMGANPPLFYYDAECKQRLQLLVATINKPQIYRQVYYMGKVCLNVIGIWRYGFSQQMWILTNMDPEAGLALYFQRMKIEISFWDLKSLLHIHKVMNKSQVYLNNMLAMVILAYAITLIVGEAIRDVKYAQVTPHELDLLTVPSVDKLSRWFLYSGPFLLLKQRYGLHQCVLRQIVKVALLIFTQLVFANVRTLVRA